MPNIIDILARALSLRQETALNSITPNRAGGIMYDTLLVLNQMQLEGGSLLISKVYASVSAMEADTTPTSDLTGRALKPGQLVVIVTSDSSSSDMGSEYRFNGPGSWTYVGKVGGLPLDTVPTQSSTKGITSGGVYTALAAMKAEGYKYMGLATPGSGGTAPGTPTQPVFYIAGPGSYPNFGSITVSSGYLGFIKYSSGSWTVESVAVGKDYDSQISALDEQISQLEAKVTDLLPLCTKRTGYYVNASSVIPGSANFDYYTYKIDGEKKIRVYTKLQYSNNLPAYLLYSTDTITADGYITHTNWKSGDGVYEISIPDNCKLLVVNVYRPNLAEPTIGMDGEVYSQLLSTINQKIATTDGNVSAIDGRVEFLENLPIDGEQIGTVIQGKFIAIDGTPQNSSSGSRYYEIQNAGYKKVYARNGRDTNSVAAIAFYSGTPDSSTLISAVPFSYTTNERTVDVPEDTLLICVGVNGSFAGNEVIRLIPDIAKMNEDIDGLEADVEEIRDIISGIRGSGVLPCDGSAAEVKELINPTRPYYFAQGWADSDNFGYLDERLKLVPEGKHFLVYTDIHLDYYGNFGLSQKQSIIMKYVQKRLRDCNVVFLGDFIGSQSTELAAQKEMAWFAADNYSKFGDRFVPVLGDHDTDRVGGGLPQGSQLTEEYIYEAYFKQAHIYGAVQDKAVSVIDTIVFSDDAEINATKRAAWKNYMRMHYYKDDDANKIRFISLQATGANFRSLPNNYNTPRIQLPFICWAISTAPDDYDIVIVAHEYQLSSEGASTISVWEREMYKALTAFRNRSSYTITAPYSGDSEEQLVWPYVKGEYPSTFDYSAKTGKVAVLQGDEHLDGVCYYDASENESNPVGYGYVQGTGDVIRIFFDRSTLVDDNGFPTDRYSDPLKVLRCYRRAVAQKGDVVLLGTTSEVLFDVVTINDDGITLTRFGDQPVAGKVGLFPIFSEEESYEAGDRVVYYETIGSAYFPKAYTFISAHAPGAFNANEVEEFIVTEPYVRNFTI